MDSIPYDSIILLGTLLLFSAYFSVSEISISGANMVKLRTQAEEHSAKAVRSLRIREDFDQSLLTVLIGNNIVKISLAVIATKLATDFYGNQGITLFTAIAIVTIAVLIFGEILPKALAKQNSEKYLLVLSGSLTMIMKIFYPATWVFLKLKNGVNRLTGAGAEQPTVTEEDVKAMVQIGEAEGTFLTQEKDLVHSALEFDDILVSDILTPRTDVMAISLTASIEEVKQIFIQEQYSRLPVFNESIDDIVGTISYRDFFAQYVQEKHFEISDILRKAYFVISAEKISNLLQELQKNKIHLAIVLDEYGGTAGIISIEDIIEEIVGEIWDEHDDNEALIELIDERKMRLDGRVSIEDVSQMFNIPVHDSSSNTLGGWISENLGHFPKIGEEMKYHHCTFVIEEVKNRRIQKVLAETVGESVSFTA